MPVTNNEIGERINSSRHRGEESSDEDGTAVINDKRTEDSQRTAAGIYERYFDSIVESGETPLLSRFTAFPDSYFDSIDNPSYFFSSRRRHTRFDCDWSSDVCSSD